MIRVKCPHCAKVLGVKDSRAGASIVCPGCDHPVKVPDLEGGGVQAAEPRARRTGAESGDKRLAKQRRERADPGAAGGRDEPFRPVKGTEYVISRTKVLAATAAAILLILVGACLILGYFADILNFYGLILGAGLTLVSLMLLGAGIVSLFSTNRLIVGKTRLQLVKGDGRVVGQVPYGNIDEVSLNKTDDRKTIGISLLDEKDAETCWPGGAKEMEGQRGLCGYDIVLPNYFDAAAREILKEIKRRLAADAETNPPAEPPQEDTQEVTVVEEEPRPRRQLTRVDDTLGAALGTPIKEYGEEIVINCPACGARKVEAATYNKRERAHFCGIPISWTTRTWVICSACGKHLFSRRSAEDLPDLSPREIAAAISLDTPAVGMVLPIVALVLGCIPVVGLGLAVAATVVNRRPGIWRVLSLAALAWTGLTHVLWAAIVATR